MTIRAAALAAAAGAVIGCAAVADGRAPGLPPSIVEAIRADAARRAGGADPRIASVESVTWRDASLGCPQPGRLYAQVLVPGWRIRVDAGGTVLAYHASRRGAWLHCAAGREQPPLPGDPAL